MDLVGAPTGSAGSLGGLAGAMVPYQMVVSPGRSMDSGYPAISAPLRDMEERTSAFTAPDMGRFDMGRDRPGYRGSPRGAIPSMFSAVGNVNTQSVFPAIPSAVGYSGELFALF